MWRKLILVYLILFADCMAQAAILWAGGEDIDFPTNDGGAAWCQSDRYRSGYARFGIRNCGVAGSFFKSNPFTPVTSFWFTFRYGLDTACTGGCTSAAGVGKSGTKYGLFLAHVGSFKIGLYAFNGSSYVLLATEPSASMAGNGSVTKYDMQVINYGTNATVNVYANGSSTATLTYTGDVTAATGNTSIDSVFIGQASWGWTSSSEIIVADTDTRGLYLVTMAPNAAGTTNNWTGAYTNVNPSWINDTSFISSSTAGDVFQTKMNGLPSGTWSVKAVKVGARAISTAANPSSISVGVFTNSSQYTPTAVSLPSLWGPTIETMMQTNPITSTTWTPTDISNLQINLKSAP